MFQFILEKLRIVWFTYADISYGSYPLATIDTIAQDGTTDTKSAIFLITNGETDEHLELLEGFVVDLINQKWNSYIKHKYYNISKINMLFRVDFIIKKLKIIIFYLVITEVPYNID